MFSYSLRTRLLTLCFLAGSLLASSMSAQQRGGGRVRPAAPADWIISLSQSVERVNINAAALRRDAFNVAQQVSATGELNDFQVNAALQKARDRVEAARKRANEQPVASPTTMIAIGKSIDILEKAREQAGSANLDDVKTEMLRQTHFVQQELFTEVDVVRRERQSLSSALLKLNQMNQDLDQATVEALGSTFEFVKAGGE
jgi:hypothetical protein